MAEQNGYYNEKEYKYFTASRRDILPLLPEQAEKVLEIGCGHGDTLLWLKTIRNCKKLAGVELFPEAAAKARERLDVVVEGNVEALELPFEPNEFDLVLCLDVLEHLADPWAVVKRLTALLKPGGSLIASIPNVKHHSVVLPLLLRGRWDYLPAGVLDKTHLRYFTKATAIELLESAGLTVDKLYSTGREKGSKSRIANILSLGLLKVFFETQYVIRAAKI
jgi:SAM-dependent methyltransferase